MTQMTERQAAAWPQALETMRRYGVDAPPDLDHWCWHAKWGEETRPGRGHRLNAVYCDGDYFVQVLMDVYGYPSVSVATVDWVHSDSDEECYCRYCEDERSEG